MPDPPVSQSEGSAERRVVCENCGEIIETEPIGGPLDTHPELDDADHLVDVSDCPICMSEDENDDA